MVGTFEQATAVEPVEPGRWAASFDPVWTIGDAVHGGCAQCAMARAAVAESGHEHPVAISAHFLAPTRPGPAEVTVEILRSGRTVSTLRTVLRQDGEDKIVGHVAAGTLRHHEPDYQAEAPVILPPEECVPRPAVMADGSPVRWLDPIEVRLDPRQVGGPNRALSGIPEVRGWVRARDDSPPDAPFLTFCVDAMPPTVLEIGGGGWSPTVQLSSYVRALPAPGWLAVVSRAAVVGDGWFDEEAEVWDSSHRLVAQGRQIGRFRFA